MASCGLRVFMAKTTVLSPGGGSSVMFFSLDSKMQSRNVC